MSVARDGPSDVFVRIAEFLSEEELLLQMVSVSITGGAGNAENNRSIWFSVIMFESIILWSAASKLCSLLFAIDRCGVGEMPSSLSWFAWLSGLDCSKSLSSSCGSSRQNEISENRTHFFLTGPRFSIGSQHARRFAGLIFSSGIPIMNLESKQQFVNGLGDNGGLIAIMINYICCSNTYVKVQKESEIWGNRSGACWHWSSLGLSGAVMESCSELYKTATFVW